MVSFLALTHHHLTKNTSIRHMRHLEAELFLLKLSSSLSATPIAVCHCIISSVVALENTVLSVGSRERQPSEWLRTP